MQSFEKQKLWLDKQWAQKHSYQFHQDWSHLRKTFNQYHKIHSFCHPIPNYFLQRNETSRNNFITSSIIFSITVKMCYMVSGSAGESKSQVVINHFENNRRRLGWLPLQEWPWKIMMIMNTSWADKGLSLWLVSY